MQQKIRAALDVEKINLSNRKDRNGCALEAQVDLEVLRDLPHEMPVRQLADERFGRLPVASDLTERNRSGPVSARHLHASSGRSFAPPLRIQLLSWNLSTGRHEPSAWCGPSSTVRSVCWKNETSLSILLHAMRSEK